MPPLAMLGVGLAGSIGGAIIGSHGASEAADAQSQAAKYAADLQKQEADNSLAFQKQEWNTQQQNMAPWLSAGKGALTNLSSLLSTPGQGLLKGWDQQFQAPTLAQAEQEPGYKFALQQGEGALQNSAAAHGNLLSGNTLTGLEKYGQDMGQQNYQNVYDRALQQYRDSYSIFQNNQANEYNRLAGLAGTGQTAASTLGQLGQQAASNVGNTYLTSGAQIGQDIQNAGAAQGSGYAAGANAWNGALGGFGGNLMSYGMLNQYLNPATAYKSGLNQIYNAGFASPSQMGVAMSG